MTVALDAKRKPKPPRKDTPRKDNPFIRYELSDSEKSAMKDARAKGTDVWEDVDRLTNSGYKLTLTWDTYTDSPACWLFAKDEHSPNFGAILSGRGRTVHNAVFEAVFKHYVIFDEVWPRASSKQDELFWDD